MKSRHRSGDSYYLEKLHLPVSTPVGFLTIVAETIFSTNQHSLWHSRLQHLSFEHLKLLISSYMYFFMTYIYTDIIVVLDEKYLNKLLYKITKVSTYPMI